MGEHRPIVVYDILRDGIGLSPIVVCLMILAFGGALLGLLIHERRRDRPIGGAIVLLVVWGLLGGWGAVNLLYQHFRCASWARSGDFRVTEGRVSDFQPRPRWKNGVPERFTVGEFTFAYGDHAIGEGGFRYAFGPGGLLRDGVRVRVAHRRGRILRLEILGD